MRIPIYYCRIWGTPASWAGGDGDKGVAFNLFRANGIG